MFEEKESFWKKKGFYLSVCTALVCVFAIGTVYYRMNYKNNNGKNLFADSVTSAPSATSSTTGGSAIGGNNQGTTDNNNEASVSVAQNNNVQSNIPKESQSPGSQPAGQKEKTTDKNKTDKTEKTDKKAASRTGTKNKAKNKTVAAAKTENTKKSGKKQAKDSSSVTAMSETGIKNKFDMEKGLLWPVSGDVILKFSMSNTVYFKTLAQYKCNPAVIIASEEGTKVKEAADGTVTKVSHSDELGNTVTVDIGSGYTLTYGQLKDISVQEGQTVKEGDTIGKVAKPTKYYSEEGSNLYFQIMEKDKSVDPLLLLR
ncbi:MAG: M23 family metallopeptidase [Lachnospiraceae bacterium]|nr:M23 family metallopeptidase [Lachnospiraceae bacterium]